MVNIAKYNLVSICTYYSINPLEKSLDATSPYPILFSHVLCVYTIVV